MMANSFKLVLAIALSIILFGGTYQCTFETIDRAVASSHEIDGYFPFRGEISLWTEDIEVRGESQKFTMCKSEPAFEFEVFTQENAFGARRLIAVVK